MTHAYENPCVISVDSIEKLPLNHFMPGENNISIAVGGCNVRCIYCQNWQQSQSKPEELKTFSLSTSEAVAGSKKKECGIIAYTYTEPVAFFEYMIDVATIAKEKNVKNVCATALSINTEPLKELCKVIDAFSISIKGFTEQFYDKVVGCRLDPILKGIETIKKENKWLELVNLIVPTYNDNLKDIKNMCKWIKEHVGSETPLHFGRFVPEYKLRDLPRTPVQTLEKCREIALETGLKHVYIFNVSPHEGNSTYCPKCSSKIIERLGFKVLDNKIKNGKCGKCNTKIAGRWT